MRDLSGRDLPIAIGAGDSEFDRVLVRLALGRESAEEGILEREVRRPVRHVEERVADAQQIRQLSDDVDVGRFVVELQKDHSLFAMLVQEPLLVPGRGPPVDDEVSCHKHERWSEEKGKVKVIACC